VSRDDYENMMEANRKRVEQLELQLQNALAAATTAASSRVSQGTSQSGDDLSVMRGVEEAVWNAPLEFDDEGVAAAARLIVGVVTENPGTAYAPKLHLALVKAISRSAENQVSLQGKCYWLNVVTQLLHLFSSTSNYGIRSPKDFGIDVSGSVPNTAKSGNMGTFPAQILTLTLTTYQMIVDEIRARVLCPDLVRAIFDPVISAGAKLGSKHHANEGPSVDRYVVELDTALREATAAQLFPAVLRQIFAQIFYDIGAALFNSMLKRPELCSAGRGIEVKLSLASFDGWPSAGWLTMQVREVLRGVSVAGMGPLREACNLFLLDKSDASMIKETCPALNARQLKALLTSFVPDDIAPTACPPKVMGNLTELIKKTDALKIDEKAWLPYQKP
jgi:hypothetical protein